MPISPLIPEGDTDLANWQAGDQDTFLELVMDAVRDFCGWHIAPTVPVAGRRCRFGADGYIMLPSRHVCEVSQVVVDGQTLVADCDYFWEPPENWLRHTLNFWPRHRVAEVSFVHGFEECPMPVKAVIFEVLSTSMELPASNATEVMTMQYRFNLKQSIGNSLSDVQKERLGKYKIHKFGGMQSP